MEPPRLNCVVVLNADVGAAAAFDAVPAGELVDLEQVGVVEDQALGILVRQLADAGLVRPHDDLRDRLDGLGAPGLDADERIAVFEADRRHGAELGAVAGRDIVGNAGNVGHRNRRGVRPQLYERREDLPEGIGDAALPLRLSGDAGVASRDATEQTVGGHFRGRVGGDERAEAIGVCRRRDRIEIRIGRGSGS